MITRVTEGVRRERGKKKKIESLFTPRAVARVSRMWGLRRSTLSSACTPLTKSEENERLFVVKFR